MAFKSESRIIPTMSGSNTCTSLKTTPVIYSNSVGAQRILFTINLGANINFDSTGVNGFSKLVIEITLSSTITGLTFTSCAVSTPASTFTCA